MKILNNKWFLSALLVLIVGLVAIAAYPDAYWQIGSDDQTGKMIYKYGGDEVPVAERLTIFPDGAIGIGAPTLSDGSQNGGGGQPLKLDVEGDIGANVYCDEKGLDCFDIATAFDITVIADNSEWPQDLPNGIPYAGMEVYNQDCQCVQVYKIANNIWEPTYSRYMEYANADFPLPYAEEGDIVFNTDCNCLWCYNGNDWENCSDTNSVSSGAFNFACETSPEILAPFYTGDSSVSVVFVPIQIDTPQPGPVTLTVNDNGFSAQRTLELAGNETEIMLNPIQYDGSGSVGTHTFEILSYEGEGSCVVEVQVKNPGSFDFDCKPSPNASGTFTTTSAGSGTLTVPIENATAGDVTVEVNHNGFRATEYITLAGGETELVLDPLYYDGSQTKNGRWSFSIFSNQGTGDCFGNVVLTP